jgi:diadenosine tetraphosphatase ApaH/serine/threonine PP2A family protein phosphatase
VRRFAVLSDVNANLEALAAVLADLDGRGVDDVVFLGDAVGYGPDPVPCVLRLRECARVYQRGRLESYLVDGREGELAPAERETVAFARRALGAVPGLPEWLRQRPRAHTADGITAAHTNPRGPEYECLLLDEMRSRPAARAAVFAAFGGVAFVGDNHQPWVFAEGDRGYTEKEAGYAYRPGAGKVLVSVGSVGQPRDGDPRACYVLVADDTIAWRRVEYDVGRTIAKLEATGGPGGVLAARLREGI